MCTSRHAAHKLLQKGTMWTSVDIFFLNAIMSCVALQTGAVTEEQSDGKTDLMCSSLLLCFFTPINNS